jgi:DivIVA domain-containing protein
VSQETGSRWSSVEPVETTGPRLRERIRDVRIRFDDPLPTDGAELADHISNVRFKPRRLRESYDMGAVDEVLDRLEKAAREGDSFVPLLPTTLPRVKVREGYDIDQVDAFLGALRARG